MTSAAARGGAFLRYPSTGLVWARPTAFRSDATPPAWPARDMEPAGSSGRGLDCFFHGWVGLGWLDSTHTTCRCWFFVCLWLLFGVVGWVALSLSFSLTRPPAEIGSARAAAGHHVFCSPSVGMTQTQSHPQPLKTFPKSVTPAGWGGGGGRGGLRPPVF